MEYIQFGRSWSTFTTVLLSEDGGRGEGDGKGFREELATLAKEVARLETVRVYAGWLFFQFSFFELCKRKNIVGRSLI